MTSRSDQKDEILEFKSPDKKLAVEIERCVLPIEVKTNRFIGHGTGRRHLRTVDGKGCGV